MAKDVSDKMITCVKGTVSFPIYLRIDMNILPLHKVEYIDMNTAMRNDQMVIKPVDALWALFQSQPKSVRDAFTKSILTENAAVAVYHRRETVKQSLRQAMKELRQAEKSGFENLPDGCNLFKS